MLACIIWVVVVVIVAGVLVWALSQLPLDPAIKGIGRVAIVVIFVIALLYTVLSCLGMHVPPLPR